MTRRNKVVQTLHLERKKNTSKVLVLLRANAQTFAATSIVKIRLSRILLGQISEADITYKFLNGTLFSKIYVRVLHLDRVRYILRLVFQVLE